MQPQAISEQNYAIVAAATATNGCNCIPYEEVKTFKRWRKDGRQVQKGQKSYVRTVTFIKYQERDAANGTEHTKTRPWHSILFCKCQTKEIVTNDAAD